MGWLGPRRERTERTSRDAAFPSPPGRTGPTPPDPLLVLVGLEAEQLHLDVVTHLERELGRRER